MPRWLRSGAAIAWRVLAIVAAVAITVYALAYLRVVVLPVIIALLLSTVLRPPARWLTRHRFSDGAAAATVMIVAIARARRAPSRWPAPPSARQFSDLADSVQDGVREAGDALAQPPFNLSKADIQEKIDEGVDKLSDSSSELTGGALHGAILVGEVLTGLIITLLLLFFFLKDGPGLWRWVVETCGGRQRRRLDELARRCYTALSGYVRGLVLVGVADATMIGTGLLILGVPLVAPLMLLTFLAAFVPLIGAFTAGLAAVLIALVSGGLVTALIVLGLVIAVQQIEGHLLYPIIMGRTVKVHPIAVILALAIGGILAGHHRRLHLRADRHGRGDRARVPARDARAPGARARPGLITDRRRRAAPGRTLAEPADDAERSIVATGACARHSPAGRVPRGDSQPTRPWRVASTLFNLTGP